MKKALQKFTPEYLKECKKMSPKEILEFIENFRNLVLSQSQVSKTKLISLKVEEDLLQSFRKKCELSGVKYQTQIKKLMRDFL